MYLRTERKKYSCHSKLVSTLLMLLSSVLSWRVSRALKEGHAAARTRTESDSVIRESDFCVAVEGRDGDMFSLLLEADLEIQEQAGRPVAVKLAKVTMK